MRAFIVRPFNPRGGIDFTRVQRELIDPALEQMGIAGDTTQQFVEAGNIRVDMFEQLLLADVVIADISVHNANVFYELGIRHALRARQTVLIRAKVSKPRAERTTEDEVPFDLKTDRYMEYDHADPGASLKELVSVLSDTWQAQRTDSPVFLSLPSLVEQERSRLSPVPPGFTEEAELAADRKDVPYLGLLAAEAAGFTWEVEGWRKVGKTLVDANAWPSARRVLERIRDVDPNDLQANLWLSTVYQKAGRVTESDQALERVLKHRSATRHDLSEAWALRGSNQKIQWIESWLGVDPPDRGAAALRSPHLVAALQSYEKAFSQDLNSFYPGLVALSLLTIRTGLIARHPEIWAEAFATEPEEAAARATLEHETAALAGAVESALESDSTNEWYPIGWADYQFLVAKKPGIAIAAYRQALGTRRQFQSTTARRQLQLFADLGLKADRAGQCLAMFAPPDAAPAPLPHLVVFTGHMVDQPGRSQPRFPESCVEAARTEIRTRLQHLRPSFGIAGAASGGDILFHEVCAELAIPTEVCLVMPPQNFVNESVAPAGDHWVERYWTLIHASQRDSRFVQLAERRHLPGWLERKQGYEIWNRANLWMLERGLSKAPERLTVMALWDGREGDGPGGTSDLLSRGQEFGATSSVIATGSLCAGSRTD
jgi:tetratricopeptide (TPR) repeat protein